MNAPFQKIGETAWHFAKSEAGQIGSRSSLTAAAFAAAAMVGASWLAPQSAQAATCGCGYCPTSCGGSCWPGGECSGSACNFCPDSCLNGCDTTPGGCAQGEQILYSCTGKPKWCCGA